MVYPVVMYGCERWTVKKAEHQRIDTFELWCWTTFFWVPRTTRRSNQSILKEINPECSLEGLMLKLKLQYSGHLMQRTDSFEKTLRLQQYVNHELPAVQAGFRKGRGTRDQIANICWIMEEAREFQKKTSISALLTMPKPLTVWITINCGKFWKRWEY